MCVAVRCSVLQCVAVCCSALQCVAVRCSVLQCAAVCCSVLQCVVVCHGVFQSLLQFMCAVPDVVLFYGNVRIFEGIIGIFCRNVEWRGVVSRKCVRIYGYISIFTDMFTTCT